MIQAAVFLTLLAVTHPGVVVEEVRPGSAGAEAGLQAGDVIVSWTREPSPPLHPRAETGTVRSPFDLRWLRIEQETRAPVRFQGYRGNEQKVWQLPSRRWWDVAARPRLPMRSRVVYQEAKRRLAAQDNAAAGRLLQEAAGAARAAARPLEAAWFLSRLADVHAEAAQAELEDGALASAATILEEAGELPAAALVLRDRGRVFRSRSLWERSADCYRRALELDRKLAPRSLAEAISLIGLGNLEEQQGHLDKAEELFREALALQLQLSPASNTLGVLQNLAVVAARRGDLALAEARFQEVEKIQSQAAPVSFGRAVSLGNLGNVAALRGNLAAAEDFYRRALPLFAQVTPGREHVATGQGALAGVLIDRGDLAAAEEMLRQALRYWEEKAPDHLNFAITLRSLGEVALRRGDLDAAEAFSRRALAAHEKLAPDSPEVAEYLQDVGRAAFLRGDTGSARDLLRRALAVRERATPGTLYVAESLLGLGELETEIGEDLAAAESALGRALQLFEAHAPGGLSAAISRSALGRLAFRRGDWAGAEGFLRESSAALENLAPDGSQTAEALRWLGLAEIRAGRSREGADHHCRAAEAVERQRDRVGGTQEGRSLFEASVVSYHRDCVAGRVDQGRFEEAFAFLERGRARSFLHLLAERDLRFSELPAELATRRRELAGEYERATAELGRLSPRRDGAEIQRLREKLRELRTRQEEIVGKLKATSPLLAALHHPTPLDLAAARNALDPGTVLLAYSVGEERSFLFVVQPAGERGSGLSVFPLAIGEKALRRAVGAFRNLLRDAGSDPRRLRAQGAELYRLLLRPAERRLGNSRRILISPDGPLHTLPFAALVRRGRYLAEWKPLHSVLSATVYAELRKSRRPAAAAVRMAAFGDPLYPPDLSGDRPPAARLAVLDARRRGLSLAPLPASRREVEGIAALYPEARTFLGAEATEERVKSIGREVGILHLAAHGLLDERFPLDSSLALTLPEPPEEGKDNGLLQAWEIFEQVRLDADLVTLSACDSGLGRELGGEGLVGLTRAFQYAGARSVLASLWSVSDESTSALMQHFYRSLRSGRSRDEALRSAQAALLRSRGFSHPYYWAGFQLTGDGR